MLIGDILRITATRLPAKTAVICGHRRIDYATLEAKANQFAHALMARGLGVGDNLAIQSSNQLEYPIVHFGVAKSGAVLVHLSARYFQDELVYVLNKADAKLIVVEDALGAQMAEVQKQVPGLAAIVPLSTVDEFCAGHPETPPEVAIDPAAACSMTYTGGTTGFPKGTLVSHRARAANMLAVLAQFDLREDDVVAVATPLFHVAGLAVWYQPAVALGATCVFLPRWDTGAFIEAVEREAITNAFFVPTQLNDLLHHPDFSRARLASLKTVSFAGAPMPLPLIQALMEALPDGTFIENYGQSETGPLTVCRTSERHDKLGSIGLPAVGVELRIVDPEGNVQPPGEVGEIITRGDHIMLGYHGEPEQTAALFKSGPEWLWTGDLGRRDEDGYITLVDRSRDIVIIGGENVYPAEVENALYGHDAVEECAVFGIPHERLGEVPAAAVVLKAGAKAEEDELIDFCAARIARNKRPRKIDFVSALPRTAVGKIQRNILRDPYWQGRERGI